MRESEPPPRVTLPYGVKPPERAVSVLAHAVVDASAPRECAEVRRSRPGRYSFVASVTRRTKRRTP
jgi:hypothetical protein